MQKNNWSFKSLRSLVFGDNENAYNTLSIYHEQHCNGVVGVGGGSVIDVAKVVALLITNRFIFYLCSCLFKLEHKEASYEEGKRYRNRAA